MAGAKVTRAIGKRLDKFGEDKIFALYLKHRGVRQLLKNLPPEVGTMSNGPFYEWLKADPTQGRWDRWQDVKQVIASDLVEECLTIVEDANDGTVPAARLVVEQYRWSAERYDRAAYGKPDSQTVNVISVGDDWMSGLKAVEAKARAKREAEIVQAEVVEDGTG